MFKVRIGLSFAFVAFSIACSHPSETQFSKQKPDEATEKRIAEIADSLPIDDGMRRGLQTGFRGTGIHEPWMDAMKSQNVKQVLIEVKGVWYRTEGFKPDRVVRVVYLAEYFRPGSQIVERVKLDELGKSDLQNQLAAVAIQRSKHSIPHWLTC
jgi:hypothetical protein